MRREICAMVLIAAGCAMPARSTLREPLFHPPADVGEVKEVVLREAITLEEAIAVADRMNPALQSMREEIDRVALLSFQDSLFPNPSVFVEVEDFPASDGRSLGHAERGIGISQELPVGGRLGASRDVGHRQREVAAMEYLVARRRILTEVKRAYLSALVAERGAVQAERSRDLAREFHDLTEERFEARAVPEMELLKAAVHLARSEADLQSARSSREVAMRRLLAAMGSADLPVTRLTGDLGSRFEVPALEAIRGEVVAGHPEVEMARRRKMVAQAELDLAKASRIPDVSVAVAYGWTPEEERILEGGISVPLPVINRNQGKVRSWEIRVRQADLGIVEARTRAILELEETYRTFVSAQDRVVTYEERILPQAEKALAATEEGHRAGKFSYLDVLDAQQTLEEVRRAHLAALEDLNMQAADLEGITGSPLGRTR